MDLSPKTPEYWAGGEWVRAYSCEYAYILSTPTAGCSFLLVDYTHKRLSKPQDRLSVADSELSVLIADYPILSMGRAAQIKHRYGYPGLD